MTALLSLLSLMMLASTKPVHTTSLDATTLDTTYHATSATLIPVDKNQLSLPFNQNQLSEPKARRDPPGFPPPGPGLNYVEYNLLNPNFRIPPFVVCPRDGNIFQDPAAGFPGGRLNPSYGGRALEPQFSADDIWAAFNVSTNFCYTSLKCASGVYTMNNPIIARLATPNERGACWGLRSWCHPLFHCGQPRFLQLCHRALANLAGWDTVPYSASTGYLEHL